MLIIKSLYISAIIKVIQATKFGMEITKKGDKSMQTSTPLANKPTNAYIFASWAVLAIGVISYFVGLWNATIYLSEKGFYLAVFLFALFAAVTLQKSVRDREEGIPVTNLFLGLSWGAFASSIALLIIGLINADMLLSEKGFYGLAFTLSLFAIITVQKNVRDMTNASGETDPEAIPFGSIDNPLTQAADTVSSVVENS